MTSVTTYLRTAKLLYKSLVLLNNKPRFIASGIDSYLLAARIERELRDLGYDPYDPSVIAKLKEA